MAYPQNFGQQPMQPQQQYSQQPQQQAYQQQPQQQQPPAQGGGVDLWAPTSGGGGPSEFIGIVQSCKPDSNRQDPTKQNLTWVMVDQENKPKNKAWSIGKEWNFDYNQAPPRYVDPKNPNRGVNENTTMGMLLRCIKEGVPIDLRAAAPVLCSRPGGPLSPVSWMGTRWHFAKVVLDFGQGPREVPFPIAFLGLDGTPLPAVQWVSQDHGAMPGMQQAPMGQLQQPQVQPQVQQPVQQYQQPMQQQQAYPQQPMQPQQMPAQQYQQPQAQQYQQPMQQPVQQGYQQQGFGGGPAAAPQFPGQQQHFPG